MAVGVGETADTPQPAFPPPAGPPGLSGRGPAPAGARRSWSDRPVPS